MSPEDQVQDLACHPDAFDDLKRSDATAIVNRKITEAMEPSIDSIIKIAIHGSNERLRFDASKYIIERGLPVGKDGGPESPIENLIDEIQQAVENGNSAEKAAQEAENLAIERAKQSRPAT